MFGVSMKGQANVVSGNIVFVIFVAIIGFGAGVPIIKQAIIDANLTGTDETIANLASTFLILGIVFLVAKSTGLI